MSAPSSTPNDPRPAPAAGRDHPLRLALVGEIHARPSPEIAPPEQASHLALLSGENAADSERAQIARLCERFGVAPPAAEATLFVHDFGGFRLRWERHTEFSTYTFLVRGRVDAPFESPAIRRVPADWLGDLPGERLVATHVVFLDRAAPPPDEAMLAQAFAGNPVACGDMLDGAARAWTDFHVHGDGFGRMLVHDTRLIEDQPGRLLQRLLEIETYRMMALLALPVARRFGPEVSEIDRSVSEVIARISGIEAVEDERRLLDELSDLAARLERIVAANSYRFSAARAYHALVGNRFDDLRERRVEGRQPWGPFLERRLSPAMRTCESLNQRQEILSRRLARASDLLRTRVDVKLEGQNRDLLASMNRRAKLQLRLQQTVEGLSVVAVSYYATGLIGYLFKSANAAGLAFDAELALGFTVPPIVLLVWFGVRRLRRVADKS